MTDSNANNDRRNFLQHTVGAAAAGLAISSTSHVTAQTVADAAEPEVTNDVDVLVVGGGSAGHVAAIQAGRAGAKTLIVERNSQLGGTTTTGGVAFPGLFDAWGKQVIAGIGWELVKESVELDGGKLPNFAKVPQRHFHNQVHVNQFLYAILAEEKCSEAGVEIAYYEFPQAAMKDGKNESWWYDHLNPMLTHGAICCRCYAAGFPVVSPIDRISIHFCKSATPKRVSDGQAGH